MFYDRLVVVVRDVVKMFDDMRECNKALSRMRISLRDLDSAILDMVERVDATKGDDESLVDALSNFPRRFASTAEMEALRKLRQEELDVIAEKGDTVTEFPTRVVTHGFHKPKGDDR